MRFIAIVRKSDLKIEGFRGVESLDNVVPVVGEWADLEQYAHVVVPEGQDKETLDPVLVNGEIVLEQKQEKVQKHKKNLMSVLRKERNNKLAESDWTQLADAPLKKADQELWVEYRKQLRDLPKNTVDPLNPVWPVAPSQE